MCTPALPPDYIHEITVLNDINYNNIYYNYKLKQIVLNNDYYISKYIRLVIISILNLFFISIGNMYLVLPVVLNCTFFS